MPEQPHRVPVRACSRGVELFAECQMAKRHRRRTTRYRRRSACRSVIGLRLLQLVQLLPQRWSKATLVVGRQRCPSSGVGWWLYPKTASLPQRDARWDLDSQAAFQSRARMRRQRPSSPSLSPCQFVSSAIASWTPSAVHQAGACLASVHGQGIVAAGRTVLPQS